MFSNKAFNTALLVSLSWHLICMFAVNIVVLPGKYRTRELTSVSFLGPLLETTALEILMVNKPVAVTPSYQRDYRYTKASGEREAPPLKEDARRRISARAENNIYKAFGKKLRRDKAVPNVTTAAARDAGFRDSKGVSGPASNREVIYKPKKPTLPARIRGDTSFRLELEFVVSGHGDVKNVIPVISSGDSEVDLIGIRYLKDWRFAPLTRDLSKDQDGSIEFIFEAGE